MTSGQNTPDPMDEMPQQGLNKTLFTSELPKILIVVAAILLAKALLFPGGEDAPGRNEAWLAAPVAAPDERSFAENLAAAVRAAPPEFRKGLEERVMFLAYSQLRSKGESPRTLNDPARLKREGTALIFAMAAREKGFTLMRIVALEDALRRENPVWHEEFSAALTAP